jgi:hypothetical protein
MLLMSACGGSGGCGGGGDGAILMAAGRCEWLGAAAPLTATSEEQCAATQVLEAHPADAAATEPSGVAAVIAKLPSSSRTECFV